MAIIDILPGVDVAIQVDGVTVQEYPDPDEHGQGNLVSHYIEAVSEAEFEVSIKMKRGTKIKGDVVLFNTYLDGYLADDSLLFLDQISSHGYDKIVKGKYLSGDTLQKFQFSVLKIAPDDRSSHAERGVIDDLGCIRVEVHYAVCEGLKEDCSMEQVENACSVPEKAIKGRGLTHAVSYGPLVKAEETNFWHIETIDPCEGPIAVFQFLYRSLEGLKTALVVPRTPTPTPLEEQTLDTLTPADLAELQRLARIARNAEESKVKIKRERDDDNPRPRKFTRPYAGDTQFELNDDGEFRRSVTVGPEPAPREVIELD